jgi:hypothetical protein
MRVVNKVVDLFAGESQGEDEEEKEKRRENKARKTTGTVVASTRYNG